MTGKISEGRNIKWAIHTVIMNNSKPMTNAEIDRGPSLTPHKFLINF